MSVRQVARMAGFGSKIVRKSLGSFSPSSSLFTLNFPEGGLYSVQSQSLIHQIRGRKYLSSSASASSKSEISVNDERKENNRNPESDLNSFDYTANLPDLRSRSAIVNSLWLKRCTLPM
jgi:hypothetical protein